MRRLTSTQSVTKTLDAQRSVLPIARKNGPYLTIVRQFQGSIVARKKFQYRGAKPIFPEEDYHKAQPRRDQDGKMIWPAPKSQIEKAKDFIREWSAAPTCAHANRLDEKDIICLKGTSTNHPIVPPPVNGLLSSLIKTPMALLLEPS